MSLGPSRWLIAPGTPLQCDGRFLHVFEDGFDGWSPDMNRALRFATREDAERYGAGCIVEPHHAVEVPTALLAMPHDLDDEDGDRDVG